MTGWLMLRAKRNANPSSSTRHTNATTRNGSESGGANCSRTSVPLSSHILGMTFAPCELMSTARHAWLRLPSSMSTGHAIRVRGCCRRSRGRSRNSLVGGFTQSPDPPAAGATAGSPGREFWAAASADCLTNEAIGKRRWFASCTIFLWEQPSRPRPGRIYSQRDQPSLSYPVDALRNLKILA
jgi:hypothetical protein